MDRTKRIIKSIATLEGAQRLGLLSSSFVGSALTDDETVALSAYDNAVTELLGSVRWSFLRAKKVLTNVIEGGRDFEFKYAFLLPSDFDYLFGVYGNQFNSRASDPLDVGASQVTPEGDIKISFQRYEDKLFTNYCPSTVVYQRDSLEDIEKLPSYFDSALDFAIKKNACLYFTKSTNLLRTYEGLYNKQLRIAKFMDKRGSNKKVFTRSLQAGDVPYTESY